MDTNIVKRRCSKLNNRKLANYQVRITSGRLVAYAQHVEGVEYLVTGNRVLWHLWRGEWIAR